MPSESTLDLHVHGMDCADEAAMVRRALEDLPGVRALDFDLVHGRVRVTFDAAKTAPDAIAAALRATGLHAHGHAHGGVHEAHSDEGHARNHSATAARWMLASGVLLLTGWGIEAWHADTWLEALVGHHEGGVHEADRAAVVAYALSVAAGLRPVVPRAVAALRLARLDMHVLVTVSACGAAVIGQWGEASAVVFLFALAHRLEAWSIERARAAVAALADAGPAMAADGMHRAAPTERWIEHFATIYTPLVVGAAVLVAIGPPLADGEWGVWFYRALVFLVLACPCALVISTPVTVVAALTSAARQGAVIRGGAPLEQMAAGEPAARAALAAGDVVLVEPHGAALPVAFLVGHARRALSVIRQNVSVAILTKVAFLVAAVVGTAPLWMAVMADTGATVLVTLNGLRLLRARPIR